MLFIADPIGIITARQFRTHNPRPRRIIKSNDGNPHIHRHFVNFIEFTAVHITLRAAQNGGILSVETNHTTGNRPMTGHNTISGSPLPILDQAVEFDKTPLIKQSFNPFSGRQMTPGMFFIDLHLSAPQGGRRFNLS